MVIQWHVPDHDHGQTVNGKSLDYLPDIIIALMLLRWLKCIRTAYYWITLHRNNLKYKTSNMMIVGSYVYGKHSATG